MATEIETTNAEWIELGHEIVAHLHSTGQPVYARAVGAAFASSARMLEKITEAGELLAAVADMIPDSKDPTDG